MYDSLIQQAVNCAKPDAAETLQVWQVWQVWHVWLGPAEDGDLERTSVDGVEYTS